ncbi:Pyr-redox-2 domain-containing protein [Mycena venus]|uniref:Pyr-redox-2 domain-containing protein n=1 Tax=Mycena venus TaxID=2733690 RepID=A0A8H6WUT3_9AGAR|nr:Pyr-redox-2 domain-containing protein [Mycena venus]
MSFWWNTVALPIIAFMRHAHFPEDATQSYSLFLQAEILPLLGPDPSPESGSPAYPSWMTDDNTPLEFSLVFQKTGEPLVRFAIEPSALPLAGDRTIKTLRNTLHRLSLSLAMKPQFNLSWFDICAEELLLADIQQPPEHMGHPVSETFIGFDCSHYSAAMKVYFMPRIRALVTEESPEEMLTRTTSRLGLEKPWQKIEHFLSRFLPGDRPEIDIVAVDCVPGAKNRLKIYIRTDILSYSHLECFLTLGGTLPSADVSAGLRNARLLWAAMTADGRPAGSSRYFPAGLIYYELRQSRDNPSSKVYLPVRRYLPNDLEISKSIESLDSRLSGYSQFAQTNIPHRELSTRTGIHTYVCCTVKPGGGDISLYYSLEAFAPERTVGLRRAIVRLPSDAQNIATLWVREWELLVSGKQNGDFSLAPDCCLRDLLVFSPTLRMLEGRDRVVRHLQAAPRIFYGFRILGQIAFKIVTDALHLIQGRMHFEDDDATYTAIFTLSSSGNSPWRCWALLTVLNELKKSTIPPNVLGRGAEFDTVIIGAGQAGLATAAQLHQLGLNVCIIERNSRVGDPWRNRYESLQFNTPKDFSHLPYFPFPDDWPMFPSATLVADHLEKYPQILGLDVRTSTETTRAVYDGANKTWTVQLQHSDGSKCTLNSSHLVIATGVDILGGQKPKIPQLPGLTNFRGTIFHSTAVRDAHQWMGKRVVVFGAGCSGHDICMALAKTGAAEVTMVQRSPTAVISREVLLKLFPDLYTGENKPPINVADEFYLALPTPISKILRSAMMGKLAPLDAQVIPSVPLYLAYGMVDIEIYTADSESVVFSSHPGNLILLKGLPSDVVRSIFLWMLHLLIRRAGGYYIDQGCSGLIANGSIKLRQYNSIEALVPNGIIFTDGQKLAADTIIFATGFEADSKPAAFLDESVYNETGKIGGIDDEGETIGLWCPSGHDDLWFAGGDLFNCRFYSRLLALQILRSFERQ